MNTDLFSAPPQGAAPQAPLVTFALFAYNQEKFIREAVEGAFAQTYEPLEIILSDDCSTDRTFAIMQEMAAAYRGPHRVRAVQTPKNLGVTQHVLLRGREAAGDIVVVAAGDDISLPERVGCHVPCYADPTVWGVSTGFQLIGENTGSLDESASIIGGRITQRVRPGESTYLRAMPDSYTTIQGSTASYRKQVFGFVHNQNRISYAEDQLFTFIIHALQRRIDYVTQPLILYRIHGNALSNRPPAGGRWLDNELSSMQRIDAEIEKIEFFLEFAQSHRLENIVDMAKLYQDLTIQKDRKAWSQLPKKARAKSIFRDLARRNTGALVWRLVRFFGEFPNYWPKRHLAFFETRYRKRQPKDS